MKTYTILGKEINVDSTRVEQWEDSVTLKCGNKVLYSKEWGTDQIYGVMKALEDNPDLVKFLREL